MEEPRLPSEISFENFNYTEWYRYRQIRKGNNDVVFSYLTNYVMADMERRTLTINVDNQLLEIAQQLYGEDAAEDLKQIYMPYAGSVLENPIGEQLIVFCETDLEEHMKFYWKLLKLRDAFTADTPESEALREEFGFGEYQPIIKKPTTDEELDIVYFENYEYLAQTVEDVITSCQYVNIFPPLIYERSTNMFRYYFIYLIDLQEEYRKLLDFCFNVDFYAEDLEGIY